MITDREKWHYIAAKKLSTLFKEITSKHDGDLKSLLEKMSTHHNNSEKSSTTKMNKHISSGYSLFTQCSFDATKSKLDCYRGKDCMKSFSKDLKERATKIINYEKKKKKWYH